MPGLPRSPSKRIHPHARQAQGAEDGLAHAQQVFLQGCGLWSACGERLAWAGQPQWHVLATGLGLGLNLLATWHAWRNDPERPKRLFFTAIAASPSTAHELIRGVSAWPQLHDLTKELAMQWRGLVAGVHRFDLAQGQLQLSLCVGQVQPMLKELDVPAQSLFLDDCSADLGAVPWSLPTLKAVARLASRGARLSTNTVHQQLRKDLVQCGFSVQHLADPAAHAPRLQALYQPAWTPKAALRKTFTPALASHSVLILGAGLAGSAVAFSLAQRGMAVTVLDAGTGPGAGASGLPLGLAAPHASVDDNVLSRISRAGVRATLQRCQRLLREHSDWAPTGVLEHRIAGTRALPSKDRGSTAGHEWHSPACDEQVKKAGLSGTEAALWHPIAAWIKPSTLVAAQLQQPNICVRWGCEVARLRWQDGQWQALDAAGRVLAQAAQLVLATAYASSGLLDGLGLDAARIPFNALRGQVSMGKLSDLTAATRQSLPNVPVSGHGSFVCGMTLPEPFGAGAAWCLGSSFERDAAHTLIRPEDHASNHARLAKLLPHLAAPMRQAFEAPQVLGWAGQRCTLPDRLPAVGSLDEAHWPGLSLCAGFGARGLSLSVLAGEWLSAQLCGEPSPLPLSLSKHWRAQRFFKVKS